MATAERASAEASASEQASVAASVAAVARIAALKAANALQSRLASAGTFSGSGDAGFSGFSGSGGGTEGAEASSSSQADSFLATLPPPPPPRRSGFDMAPPNPAQFQAGASGGAPQALDPLAMAMAVAQQLNQQATAAQMAAPKKSLDEILKRDRERIAAADLRNQQYVLEQKAAQKQRAKEQHAAQEQAAAAATAAAANAAKRSKTGHSAPASAGSVYVTGVPAGTSWTELEDHFGQVGPVQRVKLYKDANGEPKGDALVVYQKEASVIGATQLLNGKPPLAALQPCNPACCSAKPACHAPARGHPATRACSLTARNRMRPPRNRAPPPGKELRPGVPLTVKKAIFDGRPEPPPPPPPPPAEFNEPEADEAMRVVLVRNLHDAADAPTDAEMRRAWMDELVDEVRRALHPHRASTAPPPRPHRAPTAPPPRLHRASTARAPRLHAPHALHLICSRGCTRAGVARVLPARRGAAHRHPARLRGGALRLGHLGRGGGRRPGRPLLRGAHAQP